MKHLKYSLIVAITLSLLWAPISNGPKSIALLVFWFFAFQPWSTEEIVLFFLANLIFTVNDAMALKNGVFAFRDQEFLLMPYWEVWMWGFYFICVKKWTGLELNTLNWRVVALAIGFSLSFSISPDPMEVLPVSFTMFFVLLLVFHSKKDFLGLLSFVALGTVVEGFSTHVGLWFYPGFSTLEIILWYLCLWGGVGILFYRLGLPLASLIAKKLGRKTAP